MFAPINSLSHMTNQPGLPNGKRAPAMLWLHEAK